MIGAHGGQLVDRIDESASVDDGAPTVTLTDRGWRTAVSLACGRFSPLTGFLTRRDYERVLADGVLEDGTAWPLPITLDVSAATADRLTVGRPAALANPDGEVFGLIRVRDVYEHDWRRRAAAVFGTTDRSHPGVRLAAARHSHLVGGPVTVFERVRFGPRDLGPRETRTVFADREWDSVVGFQTRNAPHRGHEHVQRVALSGVDGLFVQPKLGAKKAGDYRDRAILAGHRTLLSTYYPEKSTALATLPAPMRYAGPREAVFDAIVRQNHGCTHFVVGRDHAGVDDYYDPFAAQERLAAAAVGVEPVMFDTVVYCDRCDGTVEQTQCPHDREAHHPPSGTAIREALRAGERPPERLVRPEVTDALLSLSDPFVDETVGDSGGDAA